MIQFLHILTAATLVLPLGLLEAFPSWKEFASSNCMLEEAPCEDCEDLLRLELENECPSIEHSQQLVIAGPALQISPCSDDGAVSRDCVEMRGCRPPPTVSHS